MQPSDFTALDFNAGLGGRSLAFRDCGFSVVAAAESDPAKQKILHEIVPDIPIFTDPVTFENLSLLPWAVIVMAVSPAAGFARGSERQKRHYKENTLAYLLSEYILRNHPKVFLLQIPTLFVRNKSFPFLSSAIQREYAITYRVCSERAYSGFPMNGRQAFFVGIRGDIGLEGFQFPDPKYESPCHAPSLEAPEAVAQWYRRLPERFEKLPVEYAFPFYSRNAKGGADWKRSGRLPSSRMLSRGRDRNAAVNTQ